jgi:hypothetical protein
MFFALSRQQFLTVLGIHTVTLHYNVPHYTVDSDILQVKSSLQNKKKGKAFPVTGHGGL